MPNLMKDADFLEYLEEHSVPAEETQIAFAAWLKENQEQHMGYSSEEIEEALMNLYELGIISVDYDENLQARFSVKDDAKFEEAVRRAREEDV